jgi:hypothetical protein
MTRTAHSAQPEDSASFLKVYRDYLLRELSEVQRRLSAGGAENESRLAQDLSS